MSTGELHDEQHTEQQEMTGQRSTVGYLFHPKFQQSSYILGHYLGVRGRVVRDGKGREAHRGREVKTSSGAIPERNKSER